MYETIFFLEPLQVRNHKTDGILKTPYEISQKYAAKCCRFD